VNLGQPVSIEAKDDGGGEWWQLDYWSYKSCKAPGESSQPTNQHPVFRPDALAVAQPTVSKHWRENITFHLAHLGVFQLRLWPQICKENKVPGSAHIKDALGDTILPASPVLCSLFNLVPADVHFPEVLLWGLPSSSVADDLASPKTFGIIIRISFDNDYTYSTPFVHSCRQASMLRALLLLLWMANCSRRVEQRRRRPGHQAFS